MRLLPAFVTSDPIGLPADTNRVLLRLDAGPVPSSINLYELGAQKTDQRRVVDPKQENYERACCSERARGRSLPEVNTNKVFSTRKKERSHCCSNPYVLPRDHDIGQKFVDRGEENGDHEERSDDVCCLPKPGDAWQPLVHVALQTADNRADYERNEKEKSYAKGDRKRTQPIDDERHDHTAVRFRFDVPHIIQCGLQLSEYRGGAHYQSDNSHAHSPKALAESA